MQKTIEIINGITRHPDYRMKQPVNLEMAKRFYGMFWGREDVFAKRARNGNYYPQCDNRWNSLCPKQAGESQTGKKVSCEDCPHMSWTKLRPEIILAHLNGYREDGTGRFRQYGSFLAG